MIEFIHNCKKKIMDALHADIALNNLVKNFYLSPQLNAAYPYVLLSDIRADKNMLNHGTQYMLYFNVNIFASNDDLGLVYEIFTKIAELLTANLFNDEYYVINCFAGKYIESPGHDLNTIKVNINYELILQSDAS